MATTGTLPSMEHMEAARSEFEKKAFEVHIFYSSHDEEDIIQGLEHVEGFLPPYDASGGSVSQRAGSSHAFPGLKRLEHMAPVLPRRTKTRRCFE